MNKSKITEIEQVPYGIYVWQIPDGRFVADEDGNLLNIPAQKGDIRKIMLLQKEAQAVGFPEGSAYFLSGHRRVTENEYQEQKMRAQLGLVPDPQDIGVAIDYEKEGTL